MNRSCMTFLQEWINSDDRKPLVIRGARQVGKTWLVRHLAKLSKKHLIEINFEKTPQIISLFSSNDPRQILLNLSAFSQEIDPEKVILFLDEIQAAPDLLAKLRWFAEDLPQLPVIAAGSLLEFVLDLHEFSMPVGRINYMYLEPMSFEEFLYARDEKLLNFLKKYDAISSIPLAIHEKLMSYFKEYIIVGGMPAAVESWVTKYSWSKINQIHNDLIATYRDDFSKYSGRVLTDRLDELMLAVPLFLGKKFMYSKVNPAVQLSSIKQALSLLCKARICHKVSGTAANGVPLGAEIQEKYLKIIFLDVGLCSSILGFSIDQINVIKDIDLINKGAIAEQVVGQLLRTIAPPYFEPNLYYWHREQKGSSAEIDYVIQYKNEVLPIEVKAGSSGSLKSLHFFMKLKNSKLAIRISSAEFSKSMISVRDHEGSVIEYPLLSIPYYLLSELPRLLNEIL